ncbi:MULTISPECIES: GtrA family protein [Azospirillum]|uniref:GtrA family protein n=1 Tax=Azospirillum TaxID=191 RepID=UPI001555C6E6|nr:GtrA family protein [Azospirillum brasilense]
MIQRLRESQFIRFLVTGGIAAGVNVASRYLLMSTMSYRWAVIVAYLCGMTTAWLLSRLFVFKSSGRSWAEEYGRFALVNMVAAAQVWLISVGLAEYLFPAVGFTFHPEDVAHLIGVVVPVFSSYIGHKHFSFARKGTAHGAG